MQTRDPQRGGDRWKSPEFWLVVALLLALMLTMLMIFSFGGEPAEKKDFLAIVLGAFGAWIGAGAAYFFGREHLREATESMLRMRGISPQERLTQTAIGTLRPKPIPRTFKVDSTVESALEWFQEDPVRFFIVVLNSQDKLQNVVHEEAIYRFLYDGPRSPTDGAPLGDLETVISFINNKADELKSDKPDASRATGALVNAAVVLEDRQTAFVANETMEREKKFVTIVVNAQSTPIGYITTADIRRFILSSENR